MVRPTVSTDGGGRAASPDETALYIVGDVNVQDRADPASAFRRVRGALSEADVLYGNLEGCLATPGENDIPGKEGWRHSEERMVDALTSVGFDAVGCANNVVYGADAVRNTMAALEREGIRYCGVGRDTTEARSPAVVTRNGVSIGFLQRTARIYGAEQVATDETPGVAAFDPESEAAFDDVASDVAALRDDVDVVVFSHHLRKTATTETERYQRRLAKRVVDAGADVVFGHGAHVNQGIETYEGTPVFHCIGQLAFDWPYARDYRDGLVLKASVSGGDLSRVSFVPVHRDENNDVYLAGPESPPGSRQFEELRDRSEDGAFEVVGGEGVVGVR